MRLQSDQLAIEKPFRSLGQQQSYSTSTCTDVEDAPNALNVGPSPKQNTVCAHWMGSPYLFQHKAFETKNRPVFLFHKGFGRVLTPRIVWRFFGDDDVVRVALVHTRIGNFYKLRSFLERGSLVAFQTSLRFQIER